MGHVNNAKFFTYFEQVRCEEFDRIGLAVGNTTSEGPILAATQCQFKAPVLHPDTLEVGALSVKESDSTWTHRYAIVSHASGRVVAEGPADLVWFDYERGRRKSFSEDAERRLFGASTLSSS